MTWAGWAVRRPYVAPVLGGVALDHLDIQRTDPVAAHLVRGLAGHGRATLLAGSSTRPVVVERAWTLSWSPGEQGVADAVRELAFAPGLVWLGETMIDRWVLPAAAGSIELPGPAPYAYTTKAASPVILTLDGSPLTVNYESEAESLPAGGALMPATSSTLQLDSIGPGVLQLVHQCQVWALASSQWSAAAFNDSNLSAQLSQVYLSP